MFKYVLGRGEYVKLLPKFGEIVIKYNIKRANVAPNVRLFMYDAPKNHIYVRKRGELITEITDSRAKYYYHNYKWLPILAFFALSLLLWAHCLAHWRKIFHMHIHRATQK